MIRFRSVPTMIAAGLMLALLGYVAVWYLEANRVRAEIARFIAARADHGIMIRSDSLEIGGFPFRLEADFGHLVVDGLPFAKPAHIEAPMLAARARPWSPGVWRFEAAQGFTVAVALGSAETTSAAAGDARGRAEAELSDPGSLVIEIDSHDLLLRTGGRSVTASHASLRLTVPGKPPEDRTTPSLTFAAVVDRAMLPSGIEPQDGVLDRLAFSGVVEGPVPEQALVPALTAWREGGGSVELRQVTIHWGAVDLAGDGTVTLDADLQPEAAFSGRIRGWGALLDDFVEAGTLTPDQANYYRLGLGLLTRTAADGKSELRAPITLQKEQIFLGPAKVGKLPLISWE
jgi:hypothetical protein